MAEPTKWLDYAGVELLWNKIKQRYDKKLDSVESHDSTIRVRDKNKISVNISKANNNAIEVKDDGVYVSTVTSLHKLTFGSDKQYVYDGSEDITVPVYDGTIN